MFNFKTVETGLKSFKNQALGPTLSLAFVIEKREAAMRI